MKKHLVLLLGLLLMLPASAIAKKNDKGYVPEYQMEGAGVTSQNAQQVLVTIVTDKKDKVKDSDLEAAAVHGIIFRDYDDATNAGLGSVASHKALMSPSAEAQHVDFFEPFFRNGDYAKYVQLVGDSRRVTKAGKQWKVSATVRVNATALKKFLREQGMVKNLGDGW